MLTGEQSWWTVGKKQICGLWILSAWKQDSWRKQRWAFICFRLESTKECFWGVFSPFTLLETNQMDLDLAEAMAFGGSWAGRRKREKKEGRGGGGKEVRGYRKRKDQGIKKIRNKDASNLWPLACVYKPRTPRAFKRKQTSRHPKKHITTRQKKKKIPTGCNPMWGGSWT